MNMIPVSSSNMVAVGYNESSQQLIIKFHSGTYEYSHVPSSIYQGLMSASSKGRYHHNFIKNTYPYIKIN